MRSLLGVGGPLDVYGTDFPTPDGTPIRDYVHVEDLASAHLVALEYVMTHRGVDAINLGTGRGASVRQVIQAAELAASRPVAARDVPRRAGDPAALWAAVDKAERLLGWRATRSLGEIMATSWRWYQRAAADGPATQGRVGSPAP
jgi:UDP-glucose 4-epimerase